jgi:DNA-binding response OmpR family regulator
MNEQLIVIIDDDEMFLTLAGIILEGEGYKVHTASDGVLAKRYLFSGVKPSLIIVDALMPNLGGDEVAKLLRENAATESVPILFISGLSAEELDELAQKTGANGYLTKPFSFDQLTEAVQKTILP